VAWILGAAVPIMLDLLDKTIHSANDLEIALGFPPIAWIVDQEKEEVIPFAKDQLRRIAHFIERERRTRGTASFSFSGITIASGTTRVVLDLAREINALGLRAIALDVNAYRPSPQYMRNPPPPPIPEPVDMKGKLLAQKEREKKDKEDALREKRNEKENKRRERLAKRASRGRALKAGKPAELELAQMETIPFESEPEDLVAIELKKSLARLRSTLGLSDILNGNATLEQIVTPPEDNLPDRIPIGRAAGGGRLPAVENLSTLLKALEPHYDVVLLDSPPLLTSADAEILCNTAGATILVVRSGTVKPGIIDRAARLLERLNPPAVGTIVNQVRVYDGGGYFKEMIDEYNSGSHEALVKEEAEESQPERKTEKTT
ncbi:MAG: hypothetical protein AAF517_10680, partial [Planctomycetota bacterium]